MNSNLEISSFKTQYVSFLLTIIDSLSTCHGILLYIFSMYFSTPFTNLKRKMYTLHYPIPAFTRTNDVMCNVLRHSSRVYIYLNLCKFSSNPCSFLSAHQYARCAFNYMVRTLWFWKESKLYLISSISWQQSCYFSGVPSYAFILIKVTDIEFCLVIYNMCVCYIEKKSNAILVGVHDIFDISFIQITDVDV